MLTFFCTLLAPSGVFFWVVLDFCEYMFHNGYGNVLHLPGCNLQRMVFVGKQDKLVFSYKYLPWTFAKGAVTMRF